VVEDKKTGELFTVHEEKDPVTAADEDAGRTAGKKYEINEFEFMYHDFHRKKDRKS